jgi:tetratricopeptide (TPR) repeat protein
MGQKEKEIVEVDVKEVISDLNSAYAKCMVGKGLALDDLERHIEAIQCYNTALQIDPNLALAWDNKAWALCNL